MKTFQDVLTFHAKFGVAPEKTTPHIPTKDVTEYRINFMQEELDEFKKAMNENNLPDAVDALIDLVYVINGTALLMGISPAAWAECWNEVQLANMSKVRASSKNDPRSKRKHQLDVVKPNGWLPPHHDPILRYYGWEPNDETE